MTKPTGRPRGGRRPGAGPKPIGSAPGRYVSVMLPPEVEGELTAGLREGETLSQLLRDGGLRLVRSRRSE